jgi:tetratricopeptide (TPR) repeat protein
VSKDQGNSRLRERLATLYAQVGLFPLALQEAQKAYELENNEATRDTLAKANYDMGRMQQASDLLQGPAAVTTTQNSSQLLALIAAHKGAWAEAKTQYENSYQKATPSIYNYIIQQWLLAINNEPYAAPANWQVDTNSEWEASLLEYFTTDTLSAEQLLARAGTSCQQTEAHFSVALSAWINADSSTARAQLEKIIALKNYSYSEYLWAKALLSADVVGE